VDIKRIRFLEDVKVNSREDYEFKKGQIYELPTASANRWVVRSKAEIIEPDGHDKSAEHSPASSDSGTAEDQGQAGKNEPKRFKKG